MAVFDPISKTIFVQTSVWCTCYNRLVSQQKLLCLLDLAVFDLTIFTVLWCSLIGGSSVLCCGRQRLSSSRAGTGL